MKLEDQLCTIAQGRILNELGVNGKTLFNYCYVSRALSDEGTFEVLPTFIDIKDLPDLATTWYFDMYTSAELGIMLPEWIKIGEKTYRIFQWTNHPDDNFLVKNHEVRVEYRHVYDENDSIPENKMIKCLTEAESRAMLLIFLLERKLISASEVNKRLNR